MAIEISTPAELDAMRLDLTADYVLVNDIDMTGFGNWTPVGDIVVAQFTGSLNGQHHKISNLVVGATSGETQRRALFGSMTATVVDLGIENFSFSSNPNFRAGAIAGAISSGSIVARCWATGNYTGTGYYLGGLAGTSAIPITDCWFRGDLNLATQDPGVWSGGIVGTGSGSPTRCYYAGAIDFGEVGQTIPPGGISGETASTDSFFDNDLAVNVNSNLDFGTPKTTAEMKDVTTYETAGWDIAVGTNASRVWGIDTNINNGYPFLQELTAPSVVGFQTYTSTTGTFAITNNDDSSRAILVFGTQSRSPANLGNFAIDGVFSNRVEVITSPAGNYRAMLGIWENADLPTTSGTYNITSDFAGSGIEYTIVELFNVDASTLTTYSETFASFPSGYSLQFTNSVSDFIGVGLSHATGVAGTVNASPSPPVEPWYQSSVDYTGGGIAILEDHAVSFSSVNVDNNREMVIVGASLSPPVSTEVVGGFNFRNTAIYVTDDINQVPMTGEQYPHEVTINGRTFNVGLTAAPSQKGDRQSNLDPRLAGTNEFQSETDFLVDLPSPGTYRISLAIGDAVFAQAHTQWAQIYDDTTLKHTAVNGLSTSGSNFRDALGTQWGEAVWPTSQQTVDVNFTSTVFRLKLNRSGEPTASKTVIAHVGIDQLEPTSTSGPTIASISDGTDSIFFDGQTGIIITGTGFGT